MATYAALLRGVNVTGHNKLPMAALRAALTDAGYRDVETYLQSGNVVFSTARTGADALATALRATIRSATGIDTDVLIRTPTQLAGIVAANPFAAEAQDPTRVHVLFLAGRPGAAAGALEPPRAPDENFVVAGREIYLHYPDGAGRSKMTAAWFEKALGRPATARNWRTVEALAELAG